MKLALQKLTVGIVLRVVHAALVELYGLDSRVRDEFDRMPEGMSYALQTGHSNQRGGIMEGHSPFAAILGQADSEHQPLLQDPQVSIDAHGERTEGFLF